MKEKDYSCKLGVFVLNHYSKQQIYPHQQKYYLDMFDVDQALLSSPCNLLLSIRGYELHWAIAHMLTPLTILKYPDAPQAPPQEFLMFQNFTPFSLPQPVSRTAWLTSMVPVPQLSALQTPETYLLNPGRTWKLTAIGPALQSLQANSSQSPWVILKLPCLTQATEISLLKTHCPSLAVQGQVTSDQRPPACLIYSKAWEGRPPLQPLFSKSPAQSTSCCSEKVRFFPFPRRFQWDSMVPTVENAQHDPHEPWFLTGVTIPQPVQSQLSGMPDCLTSYLTLNELVAEHYWGAINLSSLNYSKVMSVKSLIPCFQVNFPMLWFLISTKF